MRKITFCLIICFSLTAISCGFFTKQKSDHNNGNGSEEIPAGQNDPTGPQESPLNLVGDLRTFSNCQEAEDYIEGEQIKVLERELQRNIDCIEHPDNCPYVVMGDGATESKNETVPSASGDAANSSSPANYTTTNNQVPGAEEADFVKNDGTHIYQIAQGSLQILQSWPAKELKLLSTLKLDGEPFQLLLTENKKLVVFLRPVVSNQVVSSGEDTASYVPANFDYQRTKIAIVDVTDASDPKITSQFLTKGYYLDSRRIKSSIRLILNSYGYYSDILPYYDYTDGGLSKEEQIRKLREKHQKNIEAIKSKTLGDWLEANDFIKVGSPEKSLVDLEKCTNVHAPNYSAQYGLTRVVSLDLDTEDVSETILLSYVSDLYASEKSIYLTTPYYWWDDKAKDTDFTYIHKFALQDQAQAKYVGSGGIEGTIINQFAMDEFAGNFRVAASVHDVKDWQNVVNRVYVMSLEDNELKIKGKTEDLAAGESIQSVRFMGERGFVVTFKRVDPLFAIDLSDPENPRKIGELKVPGFSSYMQMISDNTILTIGFDADETGRVNGLKLSLFDVSDLANPKELHSYSLENGNRWTWSDATYNHKAFTYFPSKKMLAIPISGYTDSNDSSDWWGRYESSLRVFNIDEEAGITPAGSLNMSDIYVEHQEIPQYTWMQEAYISRSIFADDFVYAISDLGVRVVNTNDFGSVVGTVKYECSEYCYQGGIYY